MALTRHAQARRPRQQTLLPTCPPLSQVLKLIRYTAKLATVTVAWDPSNSFHARLSSLEKSIGTSRYGGGTPWHAHLLQKRHHTLFTHPHTTHSKAYRLGKFLGDVNSLRKTPITTLYGLLEFVSNSGEGAYYFIDQFVWYAYKHCNYC